MRLDDEVLAVQSVALTAGAMGEIALYEKGAAT